MSTIVNQYRIFCNTENCFVNSYWGTTSPTMCPNNSNHSVNLNSISIINQINNNSVQIQQQTPPANQPPTGGRFRKIAKSFTVQPGTTDTILWSLPYPISVYGGYLTTDETQFNDQIAITVAPNTTVGVITANVNVNDIIINVSPTVIQNFFIGAYVNLFDGTNTSTMIEVISIDTNANTLTLTSGINIAFSVTTPTYVQISLIYCQLETLGHATTHTIGALKIGSAYIPTGTPIQFSYTNNSQQVQTPIFFIEHMY